LFDCHVLSDDVSVKSTLLRRQRQLRVDRPSRYTYRLLNTSAAQLPYIQFEVPRRTSILRSVYPLTTVKDDRSLLAQLIRRDHEWILRVEGQLQNCPGQLAHVPVLNTQANTRILVTQLQFRKAELLNYFVSDTCCNYHSYMFFVCLFVCPLAYLKNHTFKRQQCF